MTERKASRTACEQRAAALSTTRAAKDPVKPEVAKRPYRGRIPRKLIEEMEAEFQPRQEATQRPLVETLKHSEFDEWGLSVYPPKGA
jgi:hypothetical protein